MNMQERAGRLSGIADHDNPDFASSMVWEPNVALDRARAYYRWRYDHDAPEGKGSKPAPTPPHAMRFTALRLRRSRALKSLNGTARSPRRSSCCPEIPRKCGRQVCIPMPRGPRATRTMVSLCISLLRAPVLRGRRAPRFRLSRLIKVPRGSARCAGSVLATWERPPPHRRA